MVGTAVVVSLTGETDAAAGFIYLLRPRWHRKSFRTASRFPMPTTHEQPDFAHAKSFVLCSFQPTKSACSAAAEKCLSGVGQPLSSVSGRKRYNTLGLQAKSCAYRDASRPDWKPSAKELRPPGHPAYFPRKWYPNCKMQFDTFPQKIQNRCTLHPCEDEKYSGFHFAALSDFFKNCLRQIFCVVPMLMRDALLRNRKQRIEVSFLCNQFIECACLNNGTVLQSDNAIVSFQQSFIEGVSNNNTCNFFETKDST